MVQEQNFQPQGRDTSNGAHIHTYIPRSDGAINVGGIPYMPQDGGVRIPIARFPGAGVQVAGGNVMAPAPHVIPVVIQPGGDVHALAPPPVPAPVAQPAPVVPLVYQHPYPVGYPAYPNQAYPNQAYPYQHYQPYQAQVNHQPYNYNYPGPYPGPYRNHNSAGVPHYTNHIQQPAMGQYGLTGSENLARQLATVHGTKMNERQELKPADDDPLRMYWVRELDNTYTHHNRLTIDSGDIGQCRWYTIDGGIFYAVRLPSS